MFILTMMVEGTRTLFDFPRITMLFVTQSAFTGSDAFSCRKTQIDSMLCFEDVFPSQFHVDIYL